MKLFFKVFAPRVTERGTFVDENPMLEIGIMRDNYAGEVDSTDLLTVTWQANRNDDPSEREFYACKLSIRHAPASTAFEDAVKVARKIGKHPRAGWGMSPAEVIEALKATFVVYDPRTYEFTPYDELPSPEFARWMAMDNNGQAMVHALARDEETARAVLTAEMAGRIAGGSSWLSPERFAEWISAGQPIEKYWNSWGSNVPDYRPLDELIAPTTPSERAQLAEQEAAA